MKITIITATYNSAASIAGCVASVNEQTCENLEHLIIDGASSDNTVEIIKSIPNRVAKIISEPDQGIYEALNKGIRQAAGDVIGFLHADDTFASATTLQQVVDAFSPEGEEDQERVSGVYGNLVFVSSDDPGKVVRSWQSKAFRAKNVKYGWMPPHPTLFLRKEVYQKHGEFDTSFRIAGDYDFMLRVMTDQKIQLRYLPEVITRMQMGGASTGNLNALARKSKEDIRALRNNGFRFPFAVLAFKNLRKLPQLLRRTGCGDY